MTVKSKKTSVVMSLKKLFLQKQFNFEENVELCMLMDINELSDTMNSSYQYLRVTDLPNELLFYIFSFLSSKDIINLSYVNWTFFHLTNNPFTWKQLSKISFRMEIIYPEIVIDWKKYYYSKQIVMNDQTSFVWSSSPWSKNKKEISKCHVPTPRMSHVGCVVELSHRKKVIVYIGGQLTSTTRYNDIHFLDTETLKFEKMNVTGVPSFARMSSAVINNKIYTFGGYDGQCKLFELSVFDPIELTWTNPPCCANSDFPLARTNFAATSYGDYFFIHGGNVTSINGQYQVLGDMYMLDTRSMTWTNLTSQMKGDIPCNRSSHRMVIIRDKVYLFGGGVWTPGPPTSWLHRFNDLYSMDLTTYTWTKINTTGPSLCTFTMPFVVGPYLFVFGGQSMGEKGLCSNDLYCFDSVTSQWIKINYSGIVPKKRDIGVINLVDNKAILFGGSSGSPINDLNILHLPFSF